MTERLLTEYIKIPEYDVFGDELLFPLRLFCRV